VIMKAIIKFIEEYYSDTAIEGGIPKPSYILSHALSNAFKDSNETLIARMKTTSILAIDDLGYEAKEVMYFGTVSKPFEEIIMARYDKKRTILITTNLSLSQIGGMYGPHVKDRLKQMVYIIEFKGESKRK